MNDLLNLTWFSGDVGSEIAPIIDLLGKVSMWIISLVGFAIVLSSILKNAMHGLYAVSPKFWDRVKEVKESSLKDQKGLGENEINKALGTGMALLLSLLPNVKAMTDFDDEMLDAKTYFMRAIPMMCLAIFIGVFIYLGYPAQVAGKFSELTTAAIDMVLINTDPKELLESIPEYMVQPKFATDGSTMDEDRVVNKTANKVWSTVTTAIKSKGDIQKDASLETALAIEAWIMECMNGGEGFADYCNLDKYNFQIARCAVNQYGEADLTKVHNTVDPNGVAMFSYQKAVADLPTGTNANVDGWNVYFTLQFTPKAISTKASSYKLNMAVPTSKSSKSGKGLIIELGDSSGYGLSFSGSMRCDATVSGSTVACKIEELGNNKFKVTANGSEDVSGVTEFFNVQGVKYKYGSKETHPIENIKIGGSDIKFTSSSDSSISFTWGSSPKNKEE